MVFNTLQLEEAQKLLLNYINPKKEKITIGDTLGKVIAENIYAPIDVPHFRKSPLDGFALRASDTLDANKQKPIAIKIIDEVQAGDTRQIPNLPSRCGVKILTGAPLPFEADVVIRKEDVEYNDGQIYITDELTSNSNVIPVGDDIKKEELIFTEGELITPYHIGVLASLGISRIDTYKTPKIGVISTGNELKRPGEKIDFGQIYNSNLHSIVALINSLGGKGYGLGTVSDDIAAIKKEIQQGLNKYDIVLTTGGASVGDYDLIESTLENIGAKILFNRIAIKPGSPVIAAIKDNKLIIGLSGNPAAALISFELLVRPIIKRLRGLSQVAFKYLEVELVDGFKKKSPQRRFLRVDVQYTNGKWIAHNTGNQQSSILKSMLGCNALVDITAGSEPIKPGSKVQALLLKEDVTCYPR